MALGNVDFIGYTELFDRLRELRGNKTMVFSSHRFGQLTRYADLILYGTNRLVPIAVALIALFLGTRMTLGS